MVELPASEVGTVNRPPRAVAIRRQDEGTLAGAHENTYCAHLYLEEGPMRSWVFGCAANIAGLHECANNGCEYESTGSAGNCRAELSVRFSPGYHGGFVPANMPQLGTEGCTTMVDEATRSIRLRGV